MYPARSTLGWSALLRSAGATAPTSHEDGSHRPPHRWPGVLAEQPGRGADHEPKDEHPGRGAVCGVDACILRIGRPKHRSSGAGSDVSLWHWAVAECFSRCRDIGSAHPNTACTNVEPVTIAVPRRDLCASPATVAGSICRRCACNPHGLTARLPKRRMHLDEPE
jgi:hypothetical protein